MKVVPWKKLGIAGIAFAALGGLATVVPTFSPVVLAIALALSLSGMYATFVRERTGRTWAKYVVANALLLLFFALAARMVTYNVPARWPWVIPSLVAYVIAWLLPYLRPKLSGLLFRELITPETGVGRAISNAGWAVLPIAGVSGAFLAMYTSDQQKLILLPASGIVAMLCVIVSAQTGSHQLWRERREEEKQEHTMGQA